MRGERGLPELKARHATREAEMAAQIRVLEDAYRASMCMLKVAQSAGKEETHRHGVPESPTRCRRTVTVRVGFTVAFWHRHIIMIR